MQTTTIEKLKELMVERSILPFSEGIAPETRFREDLHLDSLDKTELIMGIEEEFGFDIDDDAAAQIKTVGEAVAAIDAAIAQRN